MLKEMTKWVGSFETLPQEAGHVGKGAKPDRIIQLNCGEGRTHTSYKESEHGRTSTIKEQK